MSLHVAFLRGMNLGGRRITNEALRACFEEMGLTDVATFRASGNVVFDGSGGGEKALAGQIEAGLGEALGYEVPVFVRSASEVRRVAAHEPFGPASEPPQGKLQVAFLSATPGKQARKEVLGMATEEDRLSIRGRELYWLPGGPISDSDLDLRAMEAALGAWTMRTKGTVAQIAAKHLEP